MSKRHDWDIHVLSNSVACECCGRREHNFRDLMCDSHTHGLDAYGSSELQIVLDLPLELIGYTLNSVGELIRDGAKLDDGMTITGLFENDLEIRVFRTKDSQGEDIFRLIFPDSSLKFPEESEEYPYSKQYESPYLNTHGNVMS